MFSVPKNRQITLRLCLCPHSSFRLESGVQQGRFVRRETVRHSTLQNPRGWRPRTGEVEAGSPAQPG